MLFTLVTLVLSYLIIGLFVAILGCRYAYTQEKNHDDGVKEIKNFFLYFLIVWPLFGPLLILELCDNYNVIDKAINRFIIGDKKKND